MSPVGPPRIGIVGPESSGKTTLAQQVAERLGVPWVPEVARDWLSARDGQYTRDDLTTLAELQLAEEEATAARHPDAPAIVCDTTPLVIRIWSEVAYGEAATALHAAEALDRYRLHLLTAPDLPWAPDPLREHPDPTDRQRLFTRYASALRDWPHVVIRGTGRRRTDSALDAVRQALEQR